VPADKRKININLIVKEDLGEALSSQILSWALTYGRYIIIITQIVVLSVFFLRFKLDRDHTDLKEAVTQKQALLESISDLETEIRKLQGKLLHIEQITSDQTNITKVLRFLQDRTPSNTSFSVLSLTTDKISLQATSGNLKSFSFFLSQFQQDKRFSEITLESIQRLADGKVEFKISSRLNLKEFK
jgi:Tfp pilus assembly protein PilN